MGYINYDNGRFDEALRWFGKANDKRFADLSAYYRLDCHFQLKDYEYVVANGDELLPKFQDERAKHVARLLSESCLVLGKADRAKAIYDGLLAESPDTSRSGLFFTASQPAVQEVLAVFAQPGSGTMKTWLKRAGRWRAALETVLAEEGVPLDLFYLAMIESGFKTRVKSPAPAAACSASFFVKPFPVPTVSPLSRTLTVNSFRWARPNWARAS